MLVKCQDLLPIIYKRGGKLLGGKTGLKRLVSWCYVVVYEEIEQCLRGGEFIFIPQYLREDDDSDTLFKYLKIADEMNASGVAIMVGSPQIPVLPEGLIELADELSMPLFEISWDEWLVDWTYEIGNMLFTYKNLDIEQKTIMLDILYNQIFDVQEFNERLRLVQHDFSIPHVVVVMEVRYPDSARNNLKYYMNAISEFISSELQEAIFLIQGFRAVFFAPVSKEEGSIEKKCREIIEKLRKSYSDYHFVIGIGSRINEIKKYNESYKQAQKMMEILLNKSMYDAVADYANLGLHYLILSQNSKKEIQYYCREKIGKLLEHDGVKNGELLTTFEIYYGNKFNLTQTARDLYIHRNTLLHRLECIEELLSRDLSDPEVCLDIMNSIILYKFVEQ